jgi:AcrR family transcriptional regulator
VVDVDVAVASGAAPTGTEPAPARSDRHEAICDAVFQLLSEVGYDRMSMDAVAARARASKATIYRAWPNKPDLVSEALTHRFGGSPEPPDTGSLRGDLIALVNGACQVANGPLGAVLTGLMTAATRNVELSRTLYTCAYLTKCPVYEAIVADAVGRGELAEGTDPELIHEVIHSMVLARKLWGAGQLDQEYVVHLVDDVLLPVLYGQPQNHVTPQQM